VNPPIADVAVIEGPLAGELALPRQVDVPRRPRGSRLWMLTAELRRDLVAVAQPFIASRLLVLVVGMLTMGLVGSGAAQWGFDPTDLTISFGRVGNLLAASFVRWDSVYYLAIAEHGYRNFHDAGFFPLYPLLIRGVAVFTRSFVIAGVLISLTAMAATLVILRRLTALEFDERTADLAVRLLAFGPMALFLSAVYTESLFLALSTGTFYAARRGRWALAGVLGGLAATARSGGILLLAPLLIMYLWGPRADSPAQTNTAWWKPRYAMRWSLLWLLLIPLGGEAVNLYFIAHGFGSAAPLHAQELYQHHQLVLPLVGLWQGVVAAWHQVMYILSGTPLTARPSQALFQFVVLVLTCAAVVGTLRRLPLAYGVYAGLGSVLLSLSAPTIGDPLAGFARYASLRFPLFMFAAAWALEHRRSRALLAGFALLLIVCTAQFANWQVVGTPTL